jgi:hypothetical protein
MKLHSNQSPISRIAFIGNLCEAIATEYSETEEGEFRGKNL